MSNIPDEYNSNQFNYKFNVNKQDNDIFNLTGFTKKGKRDSVVKSTASNVNEEPKPRCMTPYKYGRKKDILEATSNTQASVERNRSLYNRSHHNFNTNRTVNENLTTGRNNPSGVSREDFAGLFTSSKEFANTFLFDDYPLDFNQSLNDFNKGQISQRIKNRHHLTQSASKSLEKYIANHKEAFTEKLQLKPSLIDDRYDSLWEGAKEKNKRQEIIISKHLKKFINFEPEKMSKYYESYVEKFPTPSVNVKNLANLSEDPHFKKLYHSELLKQIANKKRDDEDRKEKNRYEEKEKLNKNIQDYRNHQMETKLRTRDINQSIIYTNLKMINERKQKEKLERTKERERTQIRNELIREKIEKEKKVTEESKQIIRKEVKSVLDTQVQSKRNMKIETNNNPVNSNDFKSTYEFLKMKSGSGSFGNGLVHKFLSK